MSREASGGVCGAPQVVFYDRGPTGMTWGSPMVTCQLALGMARFEAIAQQEAQRSMGSSVKKVVNAGTYSCRKMVRFNMASEHSYSNAVDIRAFEFANGRHARVEQDFGPTNGSASTAAASFLRASANRAFDEQVFSVVLTPHFDALHRDHFHFDQARYRTDGSR
jgi:hypothetical protein